MFVSTKKLMKFIKEKKLNKYAESDLTYCMYEKEKLNNDYYPAKVFHTYDKSKFVTNADIAQLYNISTWRAGKILAKLKLKVFGRTRIKDSCNYKSLYDTKIVKEYFDTFFE